MATATEKKPKTIEFFKAKLEKLRKQGNALRDKARKEKWSDLKLLRAIKYNDAEREIVLWEIHNAGLEGHILDRTISFQSGPGYEDNHALGDALEKQFPQGINDSELGQGFFYINQKHVEAVKTWLADKVARESLGSERRRDLVEALEQGKRLLSVSPTYHPLVK